MGYKLLGFVVWNGGKWWFRSNLSDRRTQLALAGAAAAGLAVAAGAIAAARQAGDE